MTAISVYFSLLENVALENILSFTMNQQVLSRNFELIISALKALGLQLSNFKGHGGPAVDNSDILKELRRMVESHEGKINEQEKRSKLQEEQIAQQQRKNQEQDELIAQQQKKNQEQDERLSGLENMIQFLKGEIESLKKENQAFKGKVELLEVGRCFFKKKYCLESVVEWE